MTYGTIERLFNLIIYQPQDIRQNHASTCKDNNIYRPNSPNIRKVTDLKANKWNASSPNREVEQTQSKARGSRETECQQNAELYTSQENFQKNLEVEYKTAKVETSLAESVESSLHKRMCEIKESMERDLMYVETRSSTERLRTLLSTVETSTTS